jgi:hypothetical protein
MVNLQTTINEISFSIFNPPPQYFRGQQCFRGFAARVHVTRHMSNITRHTSHNTYSNHQRCTAASNRRRTLCPLPRLCNFVNFHTTTSDAWRSECLRPHACRGAAVKCSRRALVEKLRCLPCLRSRCCCTNARHAQRQNPPPHDNKQNKHIYALATHGLQDMISCCTHEPLRSIGKWLG